MGSMLLAREVPPYGGDTMFANQYLAYEALSDGLKRTLDGLIGVSSSAKADVTKTREDALKQAGERRRPRCSRPSIRSCAPIPRPAARRSTRRVAHTAHIKGWTEKESLPLLRVPVGAPGAGRSSPAASAGRSGSLAFWDNRCAMHNPINDYHGFRRVMHRITLAGDKPR